MKRRKNRQEEIPADISENQVLQRQKLTA